MEAGLPFRFQRWRPVLGKKKLSPGKERLQTGELELTEMRTVGLSAPYACRQSQKQLCLSWRARERCAGPGGSFPFLDGQTINFLIGSGADAACSSLSPVDSSASTNST